MKKIIHILLVAMASISCFDLLHAQEPPQAGSPVIGWDSLKALIEYPSFHRRGSFEGVAHVSGYIKTDGSIDTLFIYANSDYFKEAVRRAVYSTKWNHLKADKYPLYFSVHFQIKGLKRLTIEVEPEKVQRIE